MSSSSSTKRLALVVAAEHHVSASASDNKHQMSLKSTSNRNAHANVLLVSFFLGCVLVMSCMCICMNYCCKSKMRRKRESNQGKLLRIPLDSPNLDSSIYTLQGDCPHRMQHCDASNPPPYRRPPTPGPPPTYESVVSKNSKYRKFGETDDYSDEADKINTNTDLEYYITSEQSTSESSIEKLRRCRFYGSCGSYKETEPSTQGLRVNIVNENYQQEDEESIKITNCEEDDELRSNNMLDQNVSSCSLEIAIKVGNSEEEEISCRSRNIGIEDVASSQRNILECHKEQNVQESISTIGHNNTQDSRIIKPATAVEDDEDITDYQVLPSYEDALVMAMNTQ